MLTPSTQQGNTKLFPNTQHVQSKGIKSDSINNQQVMVSPLLEATNQGFKNLLSTSRSENSKRDSNKKQKTSGYRISKFFVPPLTICNRDRIKEFLEEQLGKDKCDQYNNYKYNDKEGTTKIFTRDIKIIDGDSFDVIWENE